MNLTDLFLGFVLAGFAVFRWVFGSGTRTETPAAHPAHEDPKHNPAGLVLKTVFATIAIGAALGILGGLLFIYWGIYDIAASRPHLRPTMWLLTSVKRNSVQYHARNIEAPPLREPALVQRGFAVYREHCLVCHGAPGERRQQIGRGIQPTPPPLMAAVPLWADRELYWIVTHGLKMSGMPSFLPTLTENDRWASVAFMRQLPWAGPSEYRRWEAADESAQGDNAEWLIEQPEAFDTVLRQGDPALGRQLLERFGCGTCHVIPQVGRGKVGPPLDNFSERVYVAGKVANTPAQLAAFIVSPQKIEPNTAMPDLAVTPSEAFHMTAYLYSLGEGRRIKGLRNRQ